MIKRSAVAVDRVAVLLLGLALTLGGLALLAWRPGLLADVWPDSWNPVQDQVRLDTGFLDAEWWPWALGVVGVLSVVLGLGWLVSHVPNRAVGTVVLPGGPVPGTLRIDPSPAALTSPALPISVSRTGSWKHRPKAMISLSEISSVSFTLP